MLPGRDSDDLVVDSVAVDDFVTWSEWALARVGFRPSNALTLVGVCRDELMDDFDDAVAAVWGRAFHIGALAGSVLLGRTGVQAALSHVPGEDGRHRLVVFCFPHIGIGGLGTIGRVQRRGLSRASTACGALVALLDRWVEGDRVFELDADDVEQSLLCMRLASLLDDAAAPSLLDLTELVRESSVADVRRFVDLARGHEPVDVAVISGIVVHVPSGPDRVARVSADVTIDGAVITLPH
jgi:hypothetical protein